MIGPLTRADVIITCYVRVRDNNFIHIELPCLLRQREEVNPMNQHRGVCQRWLEIGRATHTSLPEVSASEPPAEKQAPSRNGPLRVPLQPLPEEPSSPPWGPVACAVGRDTPRTPAPKESCVPWVQASHPRQAQLDLWYHTSESHFKAIIRS